MSCKTIGMTTRLVIMVQLVTMVCCQYAYVTGDVDWAYTWYMDESFRMYCNSSTLSVTSSDYITWETPRHEMLTTPYNEGDYELKEWFGVEGFELFVKRTYSDTHGVYICRVFDKYNDTLRGRGIIGLNIHEPRYAELYDKYREGVVRAFIASGTFLGAIVFTCIVYQCRYRADQSRKDTGSKYSGQKKPKGHALKSYGGPYSDLWVTTADDADYDEAVRWTRL